MGATPAFSLLSSCLDDASEAPDSRRLRRRRHRDGDDGDISMSTEPRPSILTAGRDGLRVDNGVATCIDVEQLDG